MVALIDSSVLIAAKGNDAFTAWAVAITKPLITAYVSPVVLSELELGCLLSPGGMVSARRNEAFREAQCLECLTITADTARIQAQLISDARVRGVPRSRVNDFWLAASALEHDLALLTCNRRDFADIVGLKFLSP